MINVNSFSINQIIDSLPGNYPLIKDSGLWQIRTENLEDVIYSQIANESFNSFISGYAEKILDGDFGNTSKGVLITNLACFVPKHRYKYTIQNIRNILESGEPIFVIRAKDASSVSFLKAYQESNAPVEEGKTRKDWFESMGKIILGFINWQSENQDKVKKPD